MPDENRIEKKILLRAPRSRVWRALSNAAEFGEWFRAKFEGDFTAGAVAHGRIAYPGYEHLKMDILIERITPEHYFSYRWHPYAIDPKIDYSSEPMTLVEFHLEEAEGGTLLTVVESGFEHIPLERRAQAFKMNDGGWAEQMRNIDRYVSHA